MSQESPKKQFRHMLAVRLSTKKAAKFKQRYAGQGLSVAIRQAIWDELKNHPEMPLQDRSDDDVVTINFRADDDLTAALEPYAMRGLRRPLMNRAVERLLTND